VAFRRSDWNLFLQPVHVFWGLQDNAGLGPHAAISRADIAITIYRRGADGTRIDPKGLVEAGTLGDRDHLDARGDARRRRSRARGRTVRSRP
jgi:hypothetical protein